MDVRRIARAPQLPVVRRAYGVSQASDHTGRDRKHSTHLTICVVHPLARRTFGTLPGAAADYKIFVPLGSILRASIITINAKPEKTKAVSLIPLSMMAKTPSWP